MRSSVDFPAPFGPTRAANSPGSDLEVDVVEDAMGAEGERDALDGEEGIGD